MSSADITFQNALQALNARNFSAAERLFKQVLKANGKHVGALNLLAIVFMQQERFADAEPYIERAVTLAQSDVSYYNFGLISKRLNKPERALEMFGRALRLNPKVAETWNSRGAVFNDLKQYDKAVADFDQALALAPNYAEAFSNKGKSLHELGRHDEAIAAFDRAATLNPGLAEAWLGLGNVSYRLGRARQALASFDKALTLKPGLTAARLGRGYALLATGNHAEALADFDAVLGEAPDVPGAWFGRAVALDRPRRRREAAAAYRKALDLDPAYPFAKGLLLYQKILMCDWSGIADLVAEIETDIAQGRKSAGPFGWQAVGRSPQSLMGCAEIFNAERFPAVVNDRKGPVRSHDKIRIGYLSGEFRIHATSHLLIGVLEAHDKSRFETYAFDNGASDGSETRIRIERAFDQIVDIAHLSDEEAAAAVERAGIDILVDLNGYFGDGRTGVFARRPVPVQVNYLGFPGTIGARYIDYIVADATVIPDEHKPFYCEKVVRLPGCYQANDAKRPIGSRQFTRSELGLPESGFVFCCFNNSYKIAPETFDGWMRILKRVEGSVLWLIEDNADAVANLRTEAAGRGVDPERIIFAPRVPVADHLARHRAADLFLDTLPYNAHTTASDALWAGLPVLTQIGGTFPGRVAASLLRTIGLPELIVQTQSDYENLAVELATDRARLSGLKTRLEQSQLTSPLFDTQSFTRHLEAAYAVMHQRSQAGLPPEHLDI